MVASAFRRKHSRRKMSLLDRHRCFRQRPQIRVPPLFGSRQLGLIDANDDDVRRLDRELSSTIVEYFVSCASSVRRPGAVCLARGVPSALNTNAVTVNC